MTTIFTFVMNIIITSFVLLLLIVFLAAPFYVRIKHKLNFIFTLIAIYYLFVVIPHHSQVYRNRLFEVFGDHITYLLSTIFIGFIWLVWTILILFFDKNRQVEKNNFLILIQILFILLACYAISRNNLYYEMHLTLPE